jgi:Circularly permutated YpsA SLOG family
MIEKIISGGQTGVDSAALDVALEHDVTYGGWCPKGRINEKGKIDSKYSQLREIVGNYKDEKTNYDTRTRFNIRDSDATLILAPSIPLPNHIKDGTLLTIEEAKKQKKPFLLVDLSRSIPENEKIILNWLEEKSPKILNIAGPRESSWLGIYQLSRNLLERIF